MAVIKRQSHYTPSLMIKEVVEASMKQGLVTILRPDIETPAKSTSSIRRTLSADMSSKNWLAQNGFPAQTRVNGSSNLGQDGPWRSIQPQKDNQRAHGNDNKPPCYVPLLTNKRSSSAKSLEICTESLGSETGWSDSVLASYGTTPHSEASEDHQEEGQRNQIGEEEEELKDEKLSVVKYRCAPFRPFPPSIRSISSYGDSLQMQPRRGNGRLVLEAVSVPPRNYFHAQRGGGRLVLTVVHHRKSSSDDVLEDDGDKEEQDKYEVVGRELESFLPPKRIISEHKSNLVMKTNFISPGSKRNLLWVGNKQTAKFFEEEEEEVEEESDHLRISKSLPPPSPSVSSWTIPKPQPRSSFISYGYFWRNETTTVTKRGFINPAIANNTRNIYLKNGGNDDVYFAKEYMNQDVAVRMMRDGKVESFISYIKGCKKPKRSTLKWERYCIATS